MDLQEITAIHDKAMELAGFAILARSRKDESSATALFREAFELDHHAANAIAETNLEPSRSVLHRSAATLALDCGELRAAERLIAVGLAGDPPEAVAQELRQLMLRVFDQLGLK